ncbi:MAG: S-layer homology domain-containing protein [Armatimonadetes bacterium]|nr:S-layer homology domain-containing protein [Armatimonadota bacterium]
MKKLAYLLAVAVLLCATAVYAQGPFNDVPTDHWAYDAINQLQKDGVLIGYPDGTFAGKRTITRYEFATALARILAMLPGTPGERPPVDLSGYAKKSDIPDVSKFATKADLDALKKLMDEFRDELAALGVDVDALKRDVAALDARLCAVEAEQKRVKITGDVNVFAIATNHRGGAVPAVDRDNRTIGAANAAGNTNTNTLGRNISVVRDFDLNIVGRVSDKTTAVATINYGNYLNYVATVDDYVDGERPTTSGGNSTVKNSLSDNFFPYYLYIDTALGKGAVTLGRFPIQFTPYTLKKIDVDSYTSILKTDDGNYPVDGAKVGYNFGGVDLTLFAAKHDSNDYLANGLTGQPMTGFGGFALNPLGNGVLHQIANGNAVGGLNGMITQSAGVRAVVGIPWSGTLGATFYQAWSASQWVSSASFDQARVYGADVAIPFLNNYTFSGSWTQSDTLARDGAVGVGDVDYLNAAWDAKIGAGFGRLGVAAGYKSIGRNFAAAGAWDKIGRWTNPVNVKGPYVDLSYPISSSLKIVANGEFLEWKDTAQVGAAPWSFGVKDDEITKAEAGLKWGISKANSLALGYEWVKFDAKTAGSDEAVESYLTIGWAHECSANSGVKVGYQFINYDNGNSGPYGADYRGGLGVVQFGVSF